MAIELIKIKIEPAGIQKTVVIFDPKWKHENDQRSDHTMLIQEAFPADTLFLGINIFTKEAIGAGRISPLFHPADLIPLSPILFIVEFQLRLMDNRPDSAFAMQMVRNLRQEKVLATVPIVVITENIFYPYLDWFELNRLGVTIDRVFSWSSLIESLRFRRQMQSLVGGR